MSVNVGLRKRSQHETHAFCVDLTVQWHMTHAIENTNNHLTKADNIRNILQDTTTMWDINKVSTAIFATKRKSFWAALKSCAFTSWVHIIAYACFSTVSAPATGLISSNYAQAFRCKTSGSMSAISAGHATRRHNIRVSSLILEQAAMECCVVERILTLQLVAFHEDRVDFVVEYFNRPKFSPRRLLAGWA